MLTFLATMKIKAEKEQLFIHLAHELTEQTLANESGCLAYRFYKLRQPLGYAVLESFESAAAEQAHQASSHFQAIAADMLACIDGTYSRQYLDPLPEAAAGPD